MHSFDEEQHYCSLPISNHYPMSSQPQPQAGQPSVLKPVDMHVHVVGNGSGGSGCWLRVRGWRRPLAGLMLRDIGLPRTALNDDLEEIYVARLLEQLRSSSLGAAVILAQDLVYDE